MENVLSFILVIVLGCFLLVSHYNISSIVRFLFSNPFTANVAIDHYGTHCTAHGNEAVNTVCILFIPLFLSTSLCVKITCLLTFEPRNFLLLFLFWEFYHDLISTLLKLILILGFA